MRTPDNPGQPIELSGLQAEARFLPRIGAMSEPTQLTIRLLGEIAVIRGGQRLILPASRKTRALLAYLATTGQAHRRDRLCSLLWDVPYDPRGALRTSLSKLRAVVDEPGRRRIVTEGDTVRFDSAGAEVDVLVVRCALARDDGTATTQTLERAAASFRGEFAEGLDLSNCPGFHAWCVAEREEARLLHGRILRTLIERHAVVPEIALPYARALVHVDPHAVLAHATLLRLLVSSGRQREAEEQRDLAVRLLAETSHSAADEIGLTWRSLTGGPESPDQAWNRPQGGTTAPPIVTAVDDTSGAPTEPPIEMETHAPAAASAPRAEIAMEAERKQVTVLLATVPGIALAAAHLDPEEAANRLSPYMAAIKNAVRQYGGTVSQVFGDGLLALFGAPVAYQDHAVRACHAALAMRAAQQVLDGDSPDMRVGLDSGEIVVRRVFHEVSVTYEAIGPPVHAVRELAARAAGTGIYATRRTCDLVRSLIEVRAVDPVPVLPNKPPIEVCDLVGLLPIRSAWQARAARGLTPFVGRETAMATLVRALNRAQDGEGQAVVVTADAGIGKSRLVHELLTSESVKGWAVLQAAPSSFDQNTPYFAIKQLLRQWFMIDEGGDGTEISTKVEAGLAALDLQNDDIAAAILALLNVPQTDTWDQLDPAIRRQRIIQAIHAIVRQRASQAPFLLVIEDLHWTDKETRRALAYLVERLPGMQMALLATCRPEGQPEWLTKSYCTGLRLLPLEPDAAASLVASLVGTQVEAESIRRLVIERAKGTPLFLEETIHALIETGVFGGKPGDYRVTRAIDHIVIPPTVQAVLAERIDRLPPEQKALLQISAVIGDEVPLAILQSVSGTAGDGVQRALEALQAAELVYETRPSPKQSYAFKHPLTQEAAYQSLLIERRRQLHAEVLATIEALYADHLDEHVERLAHHALQGSQWEKAISHSQEAAEKAVGKSAYREASRFFESALDALGHLTQDRQTIARGIDIRIRLRPVLTTMGDFAPSLAHLGEAERLAGSIDDGRRLTRAVIQRSYLVGGQGLLDSGIEAAERACDLADTIDDELLKISAMLALAEATTLRGDALRAIGLVKPIVGRLIGDLRHERAGMFGTLSTRALGYLTLSYANLGQFDQALRCGREALMIAHEAQRPIDLAYCHYRLGLALLMKGDLPEAVESLEQGLTHCRVSYFGWLLPRLAGSLGYGYALLGQISRGSPLLEEATTQAKANGMIIAEALTTAWFAKVHALAGRLDAATLRGRYALDLARQYGYWHVEALSLRTLGTVDAERGGAHAQDAERQLREALALAEKRGFRPQAAHCRLALGRLLRQTGRRAEARRALKAAISLYEAMGMTPWLPEAHTELHLSSSRK